MIRNAVLVILIFAVIGCSLIQKEAEEKKRKKFIVQTAICFLENQGFLGIKCETSHNQLISKGMINNKSIKFLLDSGASHSFVNYAYAKKLNLIDKVTKHNISEIQTPFSSVDKGQKLTIPTFEIGGFVYSNWPVHLIDSQYKKLIIGSDFLLFNNSVLFCKYGILMNSDGTTVADSMHNFLLKNNFTCAPILDITGNKLPKDIPNFIGVSLLIKTIINNEEQLMLIDTGAAFTTAFQRHNIISRHDIERTNIMLKDASGTSIKLNSTEVDSIMVNNVCLMKNMNLAIIDKDLIIGDSQIFGTVGMDVLVEKNVIIDFGNLVMYIDKE